MERAVGEVYNIVVRNAQNVKRVGGSPTVELFGRQAATTSSAPTQSSSPSSGSNSGPTSSPLLFFVALGFGVVFTNLW